MQPAKIAIIGAGLTGLTLAHTLRHHAQVTCFEKSWRAAGRMAHREAAPYAFDHGTQFFTVRSRAFAAFLAPFIQQGLVARWDAQFVEYHGNQIAASRRWDAEYPHYVAVPGMNAMGLALAQDLSISYQTTIQALHRQPNGWQLQAAERTIDEVFDWVLFTLPAAQTAALLPDTFAGKSSLQTVRMLGCYALMLGFESPLDVPFEAALVKQADISWMSVNHSKPGRSGGYSLLTQSTNLWAEQHLDWPKEEVIAAMMHSIETVTGVSVQHAQHRDLHRWRYANIAKQRGPDFFCDPSLQLAVAGDWCIQGRVEAAFLSAQRLSQALLPLLADSAPQQTPTAD